MTEVCDEKIILYSTNIAAFYRIALRRTERETCNIDTLVMTTENDVLPQCSMETIQRCYRITKQSDPTLYLDDIAFNNRR